MRLVQEPEARQRRKATVWVPSFRLGRAATAVCDVPVCNPRQNCAKEDARSRCPAEPPAQRSHPAGVWEALTHRRPGERKLEGDWEMQRIIVGRAPKRSRGRSKGDMRWNARHRREEEGSVVIRFALATRRAEKGGRCL